MWICRNEVEIFCTVWKFRVKIEWMRFWSWCTRVCMLWEYNCVLNEATIMLYYRYEKVSGNYVSQRTGAPLIFSTRLIFEKTDYTWEKFSSWICYFFWWQWYCRCRFIERWWKLLFWWYLFFLNNCLSPMASRQSLDQMNERENEYNQVLL